MDNCKHHTEIDTRLRDSETHIAVIEANQSNSDKKLDLFVTEVKDAIFDLKNVVQKVSVKDKLVDERIKGLKEQYDNVEGFIKQITINSVARKVGIWLIGGLYLVVLGGVARVVVQWIVTKNIT